MEVGGCQACLYQALPDSSPEPSPIRFPGQEDPSSDTESGVQISVDLGVTSKMPPAAGKQGGCPEINGEYTKTRIYDLEKIAMDFGHQCRSKNPADWDRPKFSKKQAAIANGIWVLLLLVVINIFLFVKPPAVKLQVVPKSSDASSASPCPPGWKKNEGKCFFFSDVERNWTFSQNNCSSYSASLVTLDNQKEMDYVLSTIGHKLYWIGLQRENVTEPWRWTNGSLFNNWFPIRLDGFCVYLAKDSVRSTSCFVKRFWICSKIVSSSLGDENHRVGRDPGSSPTPFL